MKKIKKSLQKEGGVNYVHPRDAVDFVELLRIEEQDSVICVGPGLDSVMIYLSSFFPKLKLTLNDDNNLSLSSTKDNLEKWSKLIHSDCLTVCYSTSIDVIKVNAQFNKLIIAESLIEILDWKLWTSMVMPGGYIGLVITNLNHLNIIKSVISHNKLPLIFEEVIEPEDQSWIVLPGLDQFQNNNSDSWILSETLGPFCQLQSTQWHSKYGDPNYIQTCLIRLTKTKIV